MKPSRVILLWWSLVLVTALLLPQAGPAQVTLINVGHTNNAPALRSYALGVVVVSNLVYLANGTDGLRVYNVSNPANPLNIGHGTNTTFSYAQGVALAGNHAYLADGSLVVFDVSDPSNVSFVSSTNTGGNALAVAATGDLIFTANNNSGLWMFDASDPAHLLNIVKTNNGGTASGITLAGNHAFLANLKDGVRIYDVTNPGNPANVGHYSVAAAYKVAVAGTRIYVANGGLGLTIGDVTDPANPFQIGSTNTGGAAQGIAISGLFAYVANGADGLRVFDVSDPTHIVSVAHANNGGTATDVVVAGHYAYLANFNDGLRIYEIRPQLTVTSPGDGSLHFSWPSVASFRLQQNSSFGPDGWQTLGNLPATIGSKDQLTLPIPSGITFYRLTAE